MPKTFTLSATKATYTGKAIKPTVTVKDSKGNVIDAKYYTVTYADNINVGTETVTVKFKTNYSGTKILNFTIAPKQVTGLKSSSETTTSLKLTWTKVTGATKYIVYKSTDNKKWTKVADTTKLTYDLTKLSAGKKIYVKVVAVNAYSKNSSYSKVASVTVKK